MSLFRSSIRVGKFAVQNFFRNFWLSFITITIFILTLLTVNAVILMNVLGDVALRSVEEKIEVSVYFTPEASEPLVQSVQGYLLGLPQVRDVRYVSSEQSLELFRQNHANDQVILSSLEEIDGNPFGHALIISARSTDDFPFILEAVETPEYSAFIKEKDFTDYESVIENLNRLSTQVRIGGFALAGFFALVAVLIIFNTIRVAIYVHRDEIAIMKLVGANDWFIRSPFLLEAVMYSLVAVVIVGSIVLASFGALDPWVSRYFGVLDISVRGYFFENAVFIFGAQFVTMSVLSLLTTYIAMRRYLRV